ncbi:MAG: metallopeptidase family protein [Phycisphaerales bacterium]|nr:MAG: metallopeptidase family protein [Phycisphaerales bacterium]
MTDEERQRFDALLEDVLDVLPAHLLRLLEEIPLIVEDRPSKSILKELGMDESETLCGLHTGTAITERSVDQPAGLPDEIRIFREGIVETAGGWDQDLADQEVYEEIRITVLHEIGHHFGLDEDDLADLGYD